MDMGRSASNVKRMRIDKSEIAGKLAMLRKAIPSIRRFSRNTRTASSSTVKP